MNFVHKCVKTYCLTRFFERELIMTKTHKILLGVAVVALLSLTVAYAINTSAANARKALLDKTAHSGDCTCCSHSKSTALIAEVPVKFDEMTACPGEKATACKSEDCCTKDVACCCKDGCGCCDGCKGGVCDCDDCKCCDCCPRK